MARYIGPKCKLSRRQGIDLGKREEAARLKQSVSSRSLLVNMENRGRRMSDYALQLREK